MISPLPPQTTRTGFPGTINTIQTKLWGPGVAPRIPLPLIQSQNSILCPLEALCTAQGSSLSSPAPACLFPLPQLSQHEAGKGSAVGGQGGTRGFILRGSSLASTHQSRPQTAPRCSIVPLGPTPQRPVPGPTPSQQSQENFLPGRKRK